MIKLNLNKSSAASSGRLCALKRAAALITAAILAMVLTACPQSGGGGGTPPAPAPKHAITFSVEGTNGTLKAKADGIDETSTSPINVEQGKTVTFTAKADDGYKVDKWTVTPAEALQAGGADGSETAKVKITADTTVSVSFELIPQAILTLSPDKLNIEVKAKTADDSAITVVGCKETTLASGTKTTLTATGTTVILKGKITELNCGNNKLTELNVQGLTSLQKLDCWGNQLTALNVQGLTSLQSLSCRRNQLTELNVQGLTSLQYLDCSNNKLPELNVQGLTALQKLYCIGNQLSVLNVQGLTALKKLECHINQLNAQAMTALLNALPDRKSGNNAEATLYTEETDEPEGNCKDYTQPEDLKKAFDDAKKRNWKLQKLSKNWDHVDI